MKHLVCGRVAIWVPIRLCVSQTLAKLGIYEVYPNTFCAAYLHAMKHFLLLFPKSRLLASLKHTSRPWFEPPPTPTSLLPRSRGGRLDLQATEMVPGRQWLAFIPSLPPLCPKSTFIGTWLFKESGPRSRSFYGNWHDLWQAVVKHWLVIMPLLPSQSTFRPCALCWLWKRTASLPNLSPFHTSSPGIVSRFPINHGKSSNVSHRPRAPQSLRHFPKSHCYKP